MSEFLGRSRSRRILVVANETVAGEALRNAIQTRARRYVDEVFVVCPALSSRLRHWLSDEDRVRARAHARLDASLAALAQVGIHADGCVGDADPLGAIEETLTTFAADELIIATHPRGRSSWLKRDVVDRARGRFDLPVAHVVVDLEAEREIPEAPRVLEG